MSDSVRPHRQQPTRLPCPTLVYIKWASQVTQVVKKKKKKIHLPLREVQVQSLGWEDPLGGGNGDPGSLPGKSLGQRSWLSTV